MADRLHVELLEGIELATKVIDTAGAGGGRDAADSLRYRARLYRRLHVECPRSEVSSTALAAAEVDDRRADTHERETTR